jgi:hypothetical protein
MTAVAVISPSSSSWKKDFKDLPPVPEDLKNYI